MSFTVAAYAAADTALACVIPAKAGIRANRTNASLRLDPRLHGDDAWRSGSAGC